jgi:hypothetical protein
MKLHILENLDHKTLHFNVLMDELQEWLIYNMKMAKLAYSHEVQYIQHENGKVNVQSWSTIYTTWKWQS